MGTREEGNLGTQLGLAMRREERLLIFGKAASLSTDPIKRHTESHSVILAPAARQGDGDGPALGTKSWTQRSPSQALPSCHLWEHMVSIIQMGRAGSSMAMAMFAKQMDPLREQEG